MSLREELQALIRLQIAQTTLGDQAALDTTQRAWGTQQEVLDMLVAYCTGLEKAVLRVADEVESATGAP